VKREETLPYQVQASVKAVLNVGEVAGFRNPSVLLALLPPSPPSLPDPDSSKGWVTLPIALLPPPFSFPSPFPFFSPPYK